MALELYGTKGCPYTAELRDDLDFRGRAFVEYDVEEDAAALARMRALCAGAGAVPVLVEDGEVVQVGYGGRSCYVAVSEAP
jgi:glutaredoxin 3